jgi:hypothetical protein
LWPRADAPEPARWARLAKVTRVAFSARRKQLGNTLKQLFNASVLEDLGIDRTRRPETLSVAEYLALADRLAESPGELLLPGPGRVAGHSCDHGAGRTNEFFMARCATHEG